MNSGGLLSSAEILGFAIAVGKRTAGASCQSRSLKKSHAFACTLTARRINAEKW
jgi:hypothetical protein